MRTHLIPLLALALLLPFWSGCDSGGNTPSIDNRFAVTITDGPTASAASKATSELEGYSFFVEKEISGTDQTAFALYFNEADALSESSAESGLFGMLSRFSTRPATGTYSFAELDAMNPSTDTDAFSLFLVENAEAMDMTTDSFSYYVGDGGTLEITTSTADRVEGSFTATGTRVTFSFDETDGFTIDEAPVELDGSFTAKSSDVYLEMSDATMMPTYFGSTN